MFTAESIQGVDLDLDLDMDIDDDWEPSHLSASLPPAPLPQFQGGEPPFTTIHWFLGAFFNFLFFSFFSPCLGHCRFFSIFLSPTAPPPPPLLCFVFWSVFTLRGLTAGIFALNSL